MRYLQIALLIITMVGLRAWGVNTVTTYAVEVTGTDSDPAQGHTSANKFSDEVGRDLKLHYPARVSKITTGISGPANGPLVFHWKAEIQPCLPAESDYYFDHRGSLTTSAAIAIRLNSTKVATAKREFARAYGVMPREIETSTTANGWSLIEHFLICPLPKGK